MDRHDEKIAALAGRLARMTEQHSLLYVVGDESLRIPVLRRLIEVEGGSGDGVVARDEKGQEVSLQEQLISWDQGDTPRLIIVDHWESVWLHPDKKASFQQWLGRFTARSHTAIVFGSTQEPSSDQGLIPEWAQDEMCLLQLDELSIEEDDEGRLSEQESSAGLKDLFPPLVVPESTRRSEEPSRASTVESDDEVRPLTSDSPGASPVRRLFDMLMEVHGEEDLRINLDFDDDFSSMVGPLEARFCEWTYYQLEHRRLAKRMKDYHLLSPAKVFRMARHLKIGPQELKNLDREEQIRRVLVEMGIHEPGLPPLAEDGVQEIRRLGASFAADGQGVPTDVEGRDMSPEARVPAARRGAERLVKLVAQFLWGAGLQDIFFDVVDGNLQEFNNPGFTPSLTSADWLLDGDLGSLNYLLQAVDKERIARERKLVFMRGRCEFWGNAIFWPLNRLAAALSKEVHEGNSKEERRPPQKEAVTAVLRIIDGGLLRIPQPVQFFRRFSDDLGEHFEGWTFSREAGNARPEPELIKFYEASDSYELHRPYLYLAATNPSAVDMACQPLGERFVQPP